MLRHFRKLKFVLTSSFKLERSRRRRPDVLYLTILAGKNCFTQFMASDMNMFTQSIKFYTFYCHMFKSTRCLEKLIYQNHQIDSKDERLFFSASFTAKFRLVFVLTQKSTFSQRFHFKGDRKSIGFSKKRYKGFSK